MSELKPKVTIMIPTYNQEDYISDAIESALIQDYENLEIVVSDDCSTDKTGEIAKKYAEKDSRCKYFRNEKNLGRVGNYHHTAHDLATGDWAVNLDGDDYFKSSTFVSDAIKNINAAKAKGKSIVAYCYKQLNIQKYESKVPFTRIDDNCIVIKGKDYYLNYFWIGTFSHPSTIFNLEKAKKIGVYTLNILASDFHSLMKVFLTGDIILDKRIISFWRSHGDNASFIEAKNQYEQEITAYKDICEYAHKFCTDKEISYWYKKMSQKTKRSTKIRYIYGHKNLKSVCILLTEFNFSRAYLGLWKQFLFKKNVYS